MAFTCCKGGQKTKTVVILGATGAQGGGCLRALSQYPEFKIIAVTRNEHSEKAKSLSSYPNVTVKKADMDDGESLLPVFEGAYGVFAVTNYWEHFSPERELNQARAVAEAASKKKVKHLIWSTIEYTPDFGAKDTIPTIEMDGAAYKVPHFDAKGLADVYFTKLGVPTTLLRTSFYLENLIGFGMGPKKDKSGTFKLTFPMKESTKLPVISSCDIGGCAAGIFKDPNTIGKTIGIAGDIVTGPEIAQAISDSRGVPVSYEAISADEYRASGSPAAKDLANMFQWQEENNDAFCGRRNVEFARKLNPKLLDLKSWCLVHAKEIPMEMGADKNEE